MPLSVREWIHGLPLAPVRGRGDVVPDGITDDSRAIVPDGRRWAFIAREGAGGDGARFIDDALERGAAVILSRTGPTPEQARRRGEVVWVTVESGTLGSGLVSELAERWFGHPAKKLRLIGITGTNGKTTTAHLVQRLVAAGGIPCGLIGTVVIDDGKERKPASLTTPGAIEMSGLLARMVDHGCGAAVMEVSSHALDQGRVSGLRFEVGVFTNLTGDHLDYHGTMEAYAGAKAKLFERSARALVNAADPYARRMVEGFSGPVTWCRVVDEGGAAGREASNVDAVIEELAATHSRFRVEGLFDRAATVRLPLVGRHNVCNAVEALAAARVLGGEREELVEALERCEAVPGRLEAVRGGGEGHPAVLVDYAHTHDALDNVLRALRPLTAGRLIVVVGCGGDRDRSKRPKMARKAYELADYVVITSDNPRTEDPMAIIDDMLKGLPTEDRRDKPVLVLPDRASAIVHAVHEGREGDTVLLAGKGHEDYQIIGTTKRSFDDRIHAAAALRDYPAAARGVK